MHRFRVWLSGLIIRTPTIRHQRADVFVIQKCIDSFCCVIADHSAENRCVVEFFKKSFGTACKLWSRRNLWANISTYGKLGLFILLAIGDPLVVQKLPQQDTEYARTARQLLEDAVKQSDKLIR